MNEGLLFLFVFLSLAFSALFSGVETGLYSLNRLRLELRAKNEKNRRAVLLLSLLKNRALILCVFLVGNNIANGLSAVFAESWASHYVGEGKGVFLSAALLTPLLFFFGEALPKHLFNLFTETWTYRLAPFLLGARWVFAPLILFLQPIAKLALDFAIRAGKGIEGWKPGAHDLERLLAASGSEVTPELRHAAIEVAKRQNRQVQSIMVPREHAHVLQEGESLSDLKKALKRDGYRRYPLQNAEGNFHFYVHSLDAFRQGSPESPLSAHGVPLVELSPSFPLWKALILFEEKDSRVGLVRSPRGQVLGFVFVKDLVKGLLPIGVHEFEAF
jgi:CBS domain containing-hemolysin-like protein